jgi:dolichol-phosphate mannosyltransferase
MRRLSVPARPGVPAYSATILREPRSSKVLVIPVINEGERILRQLEAIAAEDVDVDIVIADGGSSDGSTATDGLIAREVGAVLTIESTGRLSSQLRMGFDFALRRQALWVITMDGNGKDDPDGIRHIAEALEGGADFVQGSRFVRGGVAENTPMARYLAIRLIHAPLISLAAGRWYTDTTNGFRGYSPRLLQHPKVAPFREVFLTYELLAWLPIVACRLGMETIEVPVARRYPRDEATPTKIHGTRGKLHLLSVLARAGLGAYAPNDREQELADEMTWPSL